MHERLRAAELQDALDRPRKEGELARLRIENAELTNRVQLLDAAEAAARAERDALAAELAALREDLQRGGAVPPAG
jgi:hypothetical protein